MSTPFRLHLTKPTLDKLLRLKRAAPHVLFPDLPDAHHDRLAGVREGKQCIVWDKKLPGLCLIIAAGPAHRPDPTITFRAVYYEPHRPGVPRCIRLGFYPHEIADASVARACANQIRVEARAGKSPKSKVELSKANAVKFDTMMQRFIAQKKMEIRTSADTARIMRRYVLPEWRDLSVESIGKREVSELLAKVAAGKIRREPPRKGKHTVGTPVVANTVFAQLSSFFNWYDGTYASNDYRPPITKRMRPIKRTTRKRVLSDHELRVLWLLNSMGLYGASLQMALLTGQRFGKVVQMRRDDLHDLWKHGSTRLRNLWDPTREDEPDNKHTSLVPLSSFALAIMNRLPIFNDSEFVFSESGSVPYGRWSRGKARLNAELADAGFNMEPWQHRDLRRTARTLMARAGVPTEVAEHCLGHLLPRTQRTYDRYDYAKEKKVAFAKLANLVERIVQHDGGRL